jgi:hypothetical protein
VASHDAHVHTRLNEALGISAPRYLFEGCDSLIQLLKAELAQHNVPTPDRGRTIASTLRTMWFDNITFPSAPPSPALWRPRQRLRQPYCISRGLAPTSRSRIRLGANASHHGLFVNR